MPAGVVFPKNADDIGETIRFAQRNELGLIPRAAGTSLAGQCVVNGLVVDVSKHLTRILSVDKKTRRARVEPGVFRDELNRSLAPHGMFFGPDTLENRIYRKFQSMLGNADNRQTITDNFPRRSIPRRNTGYALDLLMDAEVFDPTSGKPLNFCKLIAGSEGTLFFTTEIELDCDPLPAPHAALICGHFETVNESLQANLLARALVD
jgi:FAD/FMN-containing dehydrogenase